MVELDQYKFTLSSFEGPLKELGKSLSLDAKKERITELQRYMEAPDFWDNVERSQSMTRELKNLQDTVKTFSDLEARYSDIEMLIEMGNEENDPECFTECIPGTRNGTVFPWKSWTFWTVRKPA